MDEKRRQLLMNIPGFIILIKKPGDPKLYGPVENSWDLSVEPNRTFFFWSSDNASTNFGGSFKIDGRTWAERDLAKWKEACPDWEFAIYDARDEASLPVILNWELWLDAQELSDKTFSGIKNKHESRNLRFVEKNSQLDLLKKDPMKETKAPELVMTVTTFGRKEE